MRWIENAGFLVAVVVAALYGGAEAMHVFGVHLGACPETATRPFPWGLVVILLTLAVPKILGRATAGAIWTAIAGRFGGGSGQ